VSPRRDKNDGRRRERVHGYATSAVPGWPLRPPPVAQLRKIVSIAPVQNVFLPLFFSFECFEKCMYVFFSSVGRELVGLIVIRFCVFRDGGTVFGFFFGGVGHLLDWVCHGFVKFDIYLKIV
jgi:hypothetical protein